MIDDHELIAYADGEIDPARRAAVETALRHAPAARGQLAALHATAQVLRQQTPLVDDPANRAAIRARLAREDQRGFARWPARSAVVSLALPVLALALALLVRDGIAFWPAGRDDTCPGCQAEERAPLTSRIESATTARWLLETGCANPALLLSPTCRAQGAITTARQSPNPANRFLAYQFSAVAGMPSLGHRTRGPDACSAPAGSQPRQPSATSGCR